MRRDRKEESKKDGHGPQSTVSKKAKDPPHHSALPPKHPHFDTDPSHLPPITHGGGAEFR